MENNESQIVILPDTAMGVMNLFEPTKAGIISFASKVINDVADGNVSPLKVKLICKAMEDIAKKISEGTREYQKTEAGKYGDKEFDFFGAKMHLTVTHTEYDYDNCNDSYLKELQEKLESRKKQLRALVGPTPMGNPDTGEVYTCNPPAKTQTMGVKTTLK